MSDMARFEVWAPSATSIRVRTGETEHELTRDDRDWWSAEVADASAGDDYAFLVDDDPTPLPDPRSLWQPAGVHGPSRLYDHGAYEWSDDDWTGRQLAGSVVYELHVGTFSEDGTLDAAVGRLDHLVELGIDLVELLPVNAFNGEWGWGYDGVDWYAVHAPYGGPDALKRFVDACHERGLGVVLDVVYNHLGPSGAYLDRFGPYFTDRHATPWGPAINLDGPHSDEVRRYVIDNALMWLRDFHVDGLRLDAVHALVDDRAIHILEALAIAVQRLSVHTGRPLSLIAESDLNDPRLVTSREAGGYGLTAQWSDDFHHAVHAAVTGERQGYYRDFGSLAALAKTYTKVFFHDGIWSSFRGRTHGRQVDVFRVPAHRFLGYLQDHDQIGNRATGDRISATLSPGLLKVGAALYLTSAFTPMVFMGEEWAAGTPWQFFTSHPEPELAQAVREGRRAEFGAHGWCTDDVPDPQDPATFHRSGLDWSELECDEHAEMLDFYRRLVALRRERPAFTDPGLTGVSVRTSGADKDDRWLVVARGRLRVVANLSDRRLDVPVDGSPRAALLASSTGFVYRDGAVQLDGESVVIVELA